MPSKNDADIVVIGGGPAGLMAAGRAAELGARVVLLEKNKACGRKLLMTGNGRCNVTQLVENARDLAKNYTNGSFLISSFTRFGPRSMIDFLEDQGIKTKVEELNRVFPKSDKAQDVLNAMLGYLESGKVQINYNSNVAGLVTKGRRIRAVKLSNGQELEAKAFIITAGGCSYSSTGSDGGAWAWLAKLGHKIVEPVPALVPLKIKELWIKKLKGVSLSSVRLSSSSKTLETQGGMIFTHFGISGPAVLNFSRLIARDLNSGPVTFDLDLLPEISSEKLFSNLLSLFNQNPAWTIKRTLSTLIPSSLVPEILLLAQVSPEIKSGQVTVKQRDLLVDNLKNIHLTATGSLGFDTAMVTTGGVDVKEVDSKNMRSRLFDNLYLAGEVLNLDGPTGGFNLQMCWSTGFVAGEAGGEFISFDSAQSML